MPRYSFRSLTAGRRADLEGLFGAASVHVVGQGVSHAEPGVLACAMSSCRLVSAAPREQYPVFDRSCILRPVVDRAAEGFVDFARDRGAKIIERCGHDARKVTADVFVYTGLVSVFWKTGFKELARRSRTRWITRSSC